MTHSAQRPTPYRPRPTPDRDTERRQDPMTRERARRGHTHDPCHAKDGQSQGRSIMLQLAAGTLSMEDYNRRALDK